MRQFGVERDQRRTVVIRRPPIAGNDTRPIRRLGGVGQPAVAAQRPFRLGRDRRLLDRRAVEPCDPPAQHRHFGKAGARDRVDDVGEPGELIRLDVDDKIGRGMLGEATLDLDGEIALHQRHRREHAETQPER
jgi:hypothetical protein